MSITSDLDRLDRLAIGDAEHGLRELASTSDLDVAFRLKLYQAVRRGPACRSPDETAGMTLSRLLELAGHAADRGLAAAATPAELRDVLDRLADAVRNAGAWDREAPLWWQPLPAPSPLERRWRELAAALPSRDALAGAFADRRWLRLDALVAGDWIRALHDELERAFEGGLLELARAGVGAAGELSVRRSDAVGYFSGRETALLDACPHLAALAQWGRQDLADRLGEALRGALGRDLFPPRTAMLARYPAPSDGYAPHLDNPGGEHDNGRLLTLVLYLNGPERPCRGGEIALWNPGSDTSRPPDHVAPAVGGSAVLFDTRAVPHQVRPIDDGPARWALTLWFNDRPQAPRPIVPLPELSPTDALLGVAEPRLPPHTVLFHELDDTTPTGEIVARAVGTSRPRVGLVTTVYRGGAELDAFCDHHLALGFDQLLLIFDHLEEPGEAADAERLRARHPEHRLTMWSGAAAAERWPQDDPRLAGALRFARSGSSSHAVAGRQTLNASAALAAARSGELGGAPLDWLLHLDADELFYLEDAGRGGAALHDHFAAAEAAGLVLLRYVNHELLLPSAGPRQADFPGGFKVNPRLATVRLGARGWAETVKALRMAQTDPRPYFNGYFNGKSAVKVAVAVAAAGVHGWYLADGVDPSGGRLLAGPSVLHRHFASAGSFHKKYLDIAGSPLPPGPRLFELCPAEEAALALIRSAREAGADEATVARRLDELHRTLTTFSDSDVEILEAAGLILKPDLSRGGF